MLEELGRVKAGENLLDEVRSGSGWRVNHRGACGVVAVKHSE